MIVVLNELFQPETTTMLLRDETIYTLRVSIIPLLVAHDASSVVFSSLSQRGISTR